MAGRVNLPAPRAPDRDAHFSRTDHELNSTVPPVVSCPMADEIDDWRAEHWDEELREQYGGGV